MTHTKATPAPAPATQADRLRQSLNLLQPVAIAFGLLDALIGVAFGHTPAIISGAAATGYGILLFVARAQLQRAAVRAALATICGGLLALALNRI